MGDKIEGESASSISSGSCVCEEPVRLSTSASLAGSCKERWEMGSELDEGSNLIRLTTCKMTRRVSIYKHIVSYLMSYQSVHFWVLFFCTTFTPFSIGFVLHRYKLIFAPYTKGL